METKKCVFFFLIIALMIFFLISFATKGAHWDKVGDKDIMITVYPQVYRSLEGLITMDVLLFILCLPTLCFFHQNNANLLKILLILWVLMMVIRFILGIIFLAGEDNFCRTQINYYDDLPQIYKDYLGSENFFTTLKGAWVFEIICNLFVYVMAVVVIVLLLKQSRQS